MARASRTVNPLRFEDLEPHRFEDLVRQLAYDYRPWLSIEATGRGGADDGIDIRAFEPAPTAHLDDPEDGEDLVVPTGRPWTIQCKRERRIGPTQVRRYVTESLQGAAVPHGFILAAACDFSKKAYDAFRLALIGTGVQEFHLWGKAELEDMLFQPKNDHLLFAYFGLSLQIRKRGRQTELRAILALRKRLGRVLGSLTSDVNKEVLLRDAFDERYPLIDECPDFATRPRWGIYKVQYLTPRHSLILEVRRHLAYCKADTGEWDSLPEPMPSILEHQVVDVDIPDDPLYSRRYAAWRTFVPYGQQAELVVAAKVPLARVIGIDEEGDLFHPLPILYLDPLPSGHLVEPSETFEYLVAGMSSHDRREFDADPAKRVSFFKDFQVEAKTNQTS